MTDENRRDSLFLGSHPLVLIPGMRAGSPGAEVLLVSPGHVSISIAKAPRSIAQLMVYPCLHTCKCARM